MGTYVTIITWAGEPHVLPIDVRWALLRREELLRRAGMRSVQMLPDNSVCAAVMVSNTPDACAAARLARAILPGVAARIESMRFDDDANSGFEAPPRGDREAVCPPPPRDYLEAVLEAVVGG